MKQRFLFFMRFSDLPCEFWHYLLRESLFEGNQVYFYQKSFEKNAAFPPQNQLNSSYFKHCYFRAWSIFDLQCNWNFLKGFHQHHHLKAIFYVLFFSCSSSHQIKYFPLGNPNLFLRSSLSEKPYLSSTANLPEFHK